MTAPFQLNRAISIVNLFIRSLSATVLLAALSTALAGDPFHTLEHVLASPAASQRPAEACAQLATPAAPLSLADVVERALCANPDTRLAWINARIRAAELGQAQSAYLPNVSASVGGARTGNDILPKDHWAWNAGLNASYLLYDFGGREANRAQAEALLAAANDSHEVVVRQLFGSVVQTYFSLWAARRSVDAASQSEAAALETFKAAAARVQAGTAVPADKLQAQTAYSRRRLDRLVAEGNAATLQGELANLMGLPAQTNYTLREPKEMMPGFNLAQIDALIEEAKTRRPELAQAAAQVAASQAALGVARASGKPSIALAADSFYQDSGPVAGYSSSVGVNVSIPIFTGYNTHYRIRAAQEQVRQAQVEQERSAQTVALEVWRAWQGVKTSVETYSQSADLLDSAQAAEKLARGRYRGGLGTVLDVLNAQAESANARLTQLQSRYQLDTSRSELARSVGELVWNVLDGATNRTGSGEKQ
jgi:outer membrane protein TolC